MKSKQRLLGLKQELIDSFSKAAQYYQKHAIVQKEIGMRLLTRLDYFKLSPEKILDLGAGPGGFTLALKKRYPKAQVIATDLSFDMLSLLKKTFFSYKDKLVSDMDKLAFKDSQFDLVFANQLLHWSHDLSVTMKEIKRILKPGGLLLFSTLGPDTFKEVKNAWMHVDNYAHVNTFLDMHDFGDILMRCRFVDVVVDMEYLTARYQSVLSIAKDLKAQGVKNIHNERRRGLTTKNQWQKFTHQYELQRTESGHLPLTYEVVYGQAFCDVKTHDSVGEVRVSAENIPILNNRA